MNISKNIFASIIKTKNQKIKTVQRMQASRLPLLMYGMGGYARGLKLFLDKYEIKLDASFVDNEYKNIADNSSNIPVYGIDEVQDNYQTFNVVIGFADFKKAEEKLGKLKGCKGVYFLDSTLSMDFFDYQYVKDRWDSFLFVYNLLEDDLSKETMLAFINAKISGYPKTLYDLVKEDQYFPDDIIKLNNDEVFVDAGAYNGDTIIQFIKKIKGQYKKIYALEPDVKSYEQLQRMVTDKGYRNIELFNKGAWCESAKLTFATDEAIGARSTISEKGDIIIDAVSIDEIATDSRATYIKADIEGAELNALHGAAKTIESSKPKLAISVYHKPEDLVTIPQYLHKIQPNYRLYLRQHLYITHELVLYAI